MTESFTWSQNLLINAAIIGVGATAIMDIWSLLLKRVFHITGLNYAMVGRWLGHMVKGRLFHEGIANSRAVRGEAALGWTAHYVIGVVFAVFLLLIEGPDWLQDPTPGAALAVGVLTVSFPYFVMQPCFGMGVAASKLPKPNLARLKSLVNHVVFGAGLFISAVLAHGL